MFCTYEYAEMWRCGYAYSLYADRIACYYYRIACYYYRIAYYYYHIHSM